MFALLAKSASSSNATDHLNNQIALASEVENLKHHVSEKEDEINELQAELEKLLSNQAKSIKPSKRSQEQIDQLKDKIDDLMHQLSKERANAEAIQNEQDETIAQLKQELEKQKSITKQIMKHLGIAKTNQ